MADSSRGGCENERNPTAVKSLILEIISCTPWSSNTQCNKLYPIPLLAVPAHWWSDCRCAGAAGSFVPPPTPTAALTGTRQHHEMARAKPGTKAGASCTMPAGLHGACPAHSPLCYRRCTAAGLNERGGEASSLGFCPIKPFGALADWYSEVYMI